MQLFRKGIKPIHEDEKNLDGKGNIIEVTLKASKLQMFDAISKTVDRMWLILASYCVAEEIDSLKHVI